MTDAIKLTDMLQQRTIDYERQRHLANWLIESSPHMPKPSQFQQPQHKKQKKIFTNSIFHDSFFFLSKFGSTQAQSTEQEHQIIQSPAPITSSQAIGQASIQQQQQHPQHTNLSKSSTVFTSSQTNLPLQIVQSSRDGNKAKLRRFNSHDTSANMFSVADFENARLARRNELELVRQKQRYKMNSLSSGCDSSTGDSKGSKLSNESKSEPMSAESFLDRYSLPRIARLITSKSFCDDQHKQQSQHGNQSNSILGKSKKLSSANHHHHHVHQQSSINSNQTTATTNISNSNEMNCSNDIKSDNNNNGELFLLYRHLKKYKVYHAVNAKNGTNRKKGIKIPQDFTGKCRNVLHSSYHHSNAARLLVVRIVTLTS
ncbi:CLUMA_CG003475, isoform A [Clunio marinus]|uniref:CLUMA_CG003475, isoform A n=1 Tax=Clunio marinus TaxID=568069 RepID=A0A1J1HQS1_9DIPT|nr:CLUMA_CG003475, isoform A [Clunio marinus]